MTADLQMGVFGTGGSPYEGYNNLLYGPNGDPMTYRDYKSLQCEILEPGILQIVLSSPGKLNAVDREMHRDLSRIWLDIDQDPEVRVVIVTGADGAFSAGGDLSMVEEAVESFEVRLRTIREARDIVYNLINCAKPVVSAIDGPAVGAGLAVALLADISIATPRARIVDGHTRLGVAAGDHAAMIWPLLCGLAKSRYYLLTCEPLTGEEAERIGLVSLCVPEAELADRALTVARRLANGSQTAIRWTKSALNGWLRMAGPIFDVSLAYEMCGFGGPDVIEGVASLREKRAPKFSGVAAE